MFACWRSFYPFLNEKVFLSIAVLKRDFQDVHPKNLPPLQYLKFVWLQLSEHVDIWSCLLHVTCKGKSLNSFHYVTSIKLRSHRSHQELSYI